MAILTRGILYAATKQDRYLEEAFLSAESAKRHAPHIPITLFTDRTDNPLCSTSVFDQVLPVNAEASIGSPWAEGQLARLRALLQSPYDLTLHLDSDTRILTREFPRLFDLLEQYDVAMVETAPDASFSRFHYGQPMFSAGFNLFRRNAAIKAWLKEWVAVSERNFRWADASPLPNVPIIAHVRDESVRRDLLRMDQTSLVELLTPSVNRFGLSVKSLHYSWNYADSRLPQNNSEPVKILHSTRLKATTREDILSVACRWAKRGDVQAHKLYDYIGALDDVRSARKSWLPWRQGKKVSFQWPTPTLKYANLHLNYGQIDDAAALLEKDESAEAAAGRARVAMARGNAIEAVWLAQSAVAAAPQSAYTNAVLGQALLMVDRIVDAIPPLKKASDFHYPDSAFLLGQCWFNMRHYKNAAAAYKRELSTNPAHASAANNLLPALLGIRRYREAAEYADELLRLSPWHVPALAFKSAALSEIGRAVQAEALLKRELIKIEKLPVPQGYADLAAFNRALAFGIARDSSLEYQPRDHATRFGHHTGDLSGSRTPAIRALNESIITAAKQRIEEVPRTSDHPFHKSWPRTYKLYSWAVIMDEEGHQTPHIHSNGWLSGVYYVEIPGEMRGDDAERHGWLEFGQSEQRWHRSNVMPHHYVFPEAGMLVTFPSFYWHNTRPLKSKSRRISFAFDIIPA